MEHQVVLRKLGVPVPNFAEMVRHLLMSFYQSVQVLDSFRLRNHHLHQARKCFWSS